MARPIDRAAAALAAGRLVVVPTDTLLGLAARAGSSSAATGRLAGRPPVTAGGRSGSTRSRPGFSTAITRI